MQSNITTGNGAVKGCSNQPAWCLFICMYVCVNFCTYVSTFECIYVWYPKVAMHVCMQVHIHACTWIDSMVSWMVSWKEAVISQHLSIYDIRMYQSIYVGKSVCIQVYTTYAMVPSKEAVISQRPSGVYSTERHWHIYVYIYSYQYMRHDAFSGSVHRACVQHPAALLHIHICTRVYIKTCNVTHALPASIGRVLHWAALIHIYICTHIYINTGDTTHASAASIGCTPRSGTDT